MKFQFSLISTLVKCFLLTYNLKVQNLLQVFQALILYSFQYDCMCANQHFTMYMIWMKKITI
jgi:hypothetical protein